MINVYDNVNYDIFRYAFKQSTQNVVPNLHNYVGSHTMVLRTIDSGIGIHVKNHILGKIGEEALEFSRGWILSYVTHDLIIHTDSQINNAADKL